MDMKNLTSIILLIMLSAGMINAQESPKERMIRQGQSFSDSLMKGAVHTYLMELDSAQFVFGQVMQETVDVVVTVYGPDRKELGTYDGPARGPENFSFESETSGTYSLEIAPFEENEGYYKLELRTVEPVATQPAKRVDQLMQPYTGKETPGAAVMVMKDGEVIFREAYGMANLTYGIPFEADSPTNIGSTSKQFTAFAVALLAEQGKLSLDDDIRKYFPELPDFGNEVTIRNLLTHTSGYREYLNTLAMTGRDLSSPLDRKRMLEIVQKQPELQNEPGGEWNYNNTGYAIMTLLIEKVTDTPFPQWMKENVFQPLGMDHTIVREDQNQIVYGRTTGYVPGEDGLFREATDLGGAMGAGGIYTTLDDLAKWIRNFEDPKVGNKDVIEEMTTPFVLVTGEPTNYGLGLSIEEYKGLKFIHHGGADVAHRSMLMYFPEINAAVVTQSNISTFDGSIPRKVADIFFKDSFKEETKKDTIAEETGTFTYDPEKFDPLTGKYKLVDLGFILHFGRDGERLYTQVAGQPEVNMEAVSDSVFRLQGVDARITFHINKEGTADSLTLHQNGEHLAKRVNWEPKADELAEFTGRYFSEEIETLFTILRKEDTLVLDHYNLEELKLTPGEKDNFGAEFPIMEIEFVRNEMGEITGFNASNIRSRGILFEKQE